VYNGNEQEEEVVQVAMKTRPTMSSLMIVKMRGLLDSEK